MARAQSVILWLCALGLSAVFLYAGVLKIMRPDTFIQDVLSYRLLDYRLAFITAFFLPALELVCGVAILFCSVRREAALLIAGMMLVFILAILSAWLRGLDITCGCFGSSDVKANYAWLITRDLIILVACFPCYFWNKRE